MNIERKIGMAKEVFLWIYVTVIAAGICYAAYAGETTKSPGQIMYEKTHSR